MMSTIAGEGTNSDGREVTMTVQEREKRDAEMTGMTGERVVGKSSAVKNRIQFNPMQPPHHQQTYNMQLNGYSQISSP